jgi:two-component system, sensor histidine kinase and response regulator
MAVNTDSEEIPAPKRRGTLLVVDDEDGPRQSLRVIFKDEYDLLMAEDGPTAIELAQSNDVDVAVLDIRMAGMSGIEVLERLKYVNPDMEAIMMTAFETTDTIRQALRLRACDYINKPFDLATMRDAVNQAMQRRILEGEIHSSAEKVQELLAELQNQRVAEQIARERGDIYAHIFHDINGPLTIISGFVQLLNQRLNRTTRMEVEDLEFVKNRLGIVTRQTASCIEISRRYLDNLRNKSGQGAPRVSVSQLLKDLEHLVRAHPSLHENELTITPFGEDVGVKVNSTEVIQILRNLAVNALQCTAKPHRVEIGGEVLRAPLDLAKFKDGPNDRLLNVESMENAAPLVKFFVRDTGPGIPAEVLPKIFQPYFTTKGPREGTGLGLNIVQRFIKEGNGALHVHTQTGEGTTFTVYLPGANLAK